MKQNVWKLLVVVVLIAAIAAVVAARNRGCDMKPTPASRTQTKPVQREPSDSPVKAESEVARTKKHVDATASVAEPRTAASKPPSELGRPDVAPPGKKENAIEAEGGGGKAASHKTAPKALPKLVDLGADRCIPCRMMAPILEEISSEYRGKLKVEFIDVWKNREAGERYGIRAIPTQIFYDESGKEFFRHEGFISKEDILATFREYGIKLDKE